ncbi:Hypp7902 [Branchiostoma lanceolatum]|uniref:Hypp7902 protein n=1 Tax=Branchiostoma lanceolatum TaxID=7740 RepID=A0A8J9Z485_BRALA|nr:Hypp7902 [Branchiostoma lanceolatum]
MRRFALLLIWIAVVAPASIEPGRDERSSNKEKKTSDAAERSHCPRLLPPTGGTYNCFVDRYGTHTCSAACWPGLEFQSPSQPLICTAADGVWTPTDRFPNCIRESTAAGTCPALLAPVYGGYSCRMGSDGVKTCSGSCADGYEFDAPTTSLTCDPNVGTWTPTDQFPNCRPSTRARRSSQVATQCEPIPPPMSGSYSCMLDHLGRMTCNPTCMDGFEFEAPPAAEYVCADGAWSPPGPYPNCVFAGQKCEKIPPPVWGSYHCQTDHTGTERCYPACMQGYEFESPAAAEYVCINGQFSPPGPYPNCRKSEGE